MKEKRERRDLAFSNFKDDRYERRRSGTIQSKNNKKSSEKSDDGLKRSGSINGSVNKQEREPMIPNDDFGNFQ